MDDDLYGTRVVITGGSRGIGRATAVRLGAAGARVLVGHRSTGSADDLSAELARLGAEHHAVCADLTAPGGPATLAEAADDLLGGVDAVVNNAGVDGHRELPDLDPDEWHRVLETDLTAPARVVSALLPHLTAPASVVNVGASVALRGRPGSAHHGAAKAGMVGLTRSLAKELGPRGVRVNLVAPGVIDSGDVPPPIAARVAGMTALGRLGTCDDVAEAIAFLVAPRSRYITGTTLTVDGGM